MNRVGVLGEFVVSEAIKRAVRKADSLGKVPAFKDLPRQSKSCSVRVPRE